MADALLHPDRDTRNIGEVAESLMGSCTFLADILKQHDRPFDESMVHGLAQIVGSMQRDAYTLWEHEMNVEPPTAAAA